MVASCPPRASRLGLVLPPSPCLIPSSDSRLSYASPSTRVLLPPERALRHTAFVHLTPTIQPFFSQAALSCGHPRTASTLGCGASIRSSVLLYASLSRVQVRSVRLFPAQLPKLGPPTPKIQLLSQHRQVLLVHVFLLLSPSCLSLDSDYPRYSVASGIL